MRVADPQVVRRRLEDARANLLDKSLRNRLINFRARGKSGDLGRRVVEVVGEAPVELFRLMVLERRSFSFLPKPQQARQELTFDDVGDPEDLAEFERMAREELNAGTPASAADTKLQTDETPLALEQKLTKMHREARLSLEEQGVNVLFLALGMLDWVDGNGESRRAPLLLVPATLDRTKRGLYRLRWDETEVGANLSMIAKAKEFDLTLPDLPETLIDVAGYFGEVGASLRARPGWAVDSNAVVLAFFSYAKYLMYRDLDAESWPDYAKPWDHDDLGALLQTGFDDPHDTLAEDPFLDPMRPVRSMNEVTEADGSQALAILQANSGLSMLIEGPPGTGKSQTITNLIADAIAEGRTVLFVAEKLAALEVVQRRLVAARLGEACLELHSNKASKKSFYGELGRVVHGSLPPAINLEGEIDALERDRDALNSYADAMNVPIEGRGVSPRQAFDALSGLSRETSPAGRVDFATMAGWSQADFDRRLPIVRALQEHVSRFGKPSDNPFYGSTLELFLPPDRLDLAESLASTSQALEVARRESAEVARPIGLEPPVDLREIGQVIATVDAIGNAPDHSEVHVSDPNWDHFDSQIRKVLESGVRWRAIHDEFDSRLRPGAWGRDVSQERRAIAEHGAQWYGVVFGSLRMARRLLQELAVEPTPTREAQLEILDAILEEKRLRTDIESSTVGVLFGRLWKGVDSRWEATGEASLAVIHGWVRKIRDAHQSGVLHAQALEVLDSEQRQSPEERASKLASLQRAAQELLRQLRTLATRVGMSASHPILLGSLDAQARIIANWTQNLDRLQEQVAWYKLTREAVAQGIGVEPVTDLVERYERAWYEGGLREAMRARPPLGGFDVQVHEAVRREFQERDTRLQELNRRRIARKHQEGVPRQGLAGNLRWLWHQLELSRNQAPIRRAMSQAGDAVLAIKPVFLMSPLSVAMYLPPDGPRFDIVIFDEASQVKPEDALGAILRAAQTIVVGDSKQMPPTSFFDKLTTDPTEDEDADEEGIHDLESLHGAMNQSIAPGSARRRTLRWHYRSRHDSLIQTSNRLFYGDKLIVFPSPERSGDDLGLVYHHLKDTVYGRGNSRTNPEEAKAVAAAALAHVQEHPDQTLGIAAFSQAQQEAIHNALDRLRLTNPELDAFDEAHPFEPIFVKNLENVQGDERDVVFLSLGYGRDASGKVSLNFGPLNQAGGERRLNVLITRSRLRCEIYTNLVPSDLNLSPDSPPGLANLKEFLQFAWEWSQKPKEVDSAQRSLPFEGAEPLRTLSRSVQSALAARGYMADAHVGHGDFTVDLAVRDPEAEGSYRLAIEFDGEKYHRARTCRDRDKLRDQVLADRGWRVYRLWSPTWWHDPEKETDRIVEAIRTATDVMVREPLVANIEVEDEDGVAITPRESVAVIAYEVATVRTARPANIAEADRRLIAEAVKEVVDVEGPVHVDELLRRVREAWQVERVGPRMKEAFTQSVAIAAKNGWVSQDGEFLDRPGREEIVVRTRQYLPAASRNADLVHPDELRAAMASVVRDSFGITREEAVRLSLKALGVSQPRSKNGVEAILAAMVEDGTVVDRDGTLRSGS